MTRRASARGAPRTSISERGELQLTSRIAYASVLAALAALVLAGPAHAHAVLVATDPPAGETLARRPERVTLTFTGDVSLALGGVTIYAPDGRKVNAGRAAVTDNEVVVPIETDQQGTHAVSWRVLSDDGHPVSGAFVFSVGHVSESSVGAERAREAAATSRFLSIGFGVSRLAYLLGILFATGGALFATFVVPGWRPRLLRASLVLALLGIVSAFFLEAAIAAGIGLLDAFDGDLVRTQVETVYGRGALIRAALAVVALVAGVAYSRPAATWQRLVVAVTFVCLAASLSITGHATSTDPIWLRLPLDMVHTLLAAAWLGGLFQLWRYAESPDLDAAAVARYSRLAFSSVVGLVLTGSYAALAESGYSLRALWGTDYGWLLLAKLAAFATAIPLAYVNRSRNVPRLLAGVDARRALSRYVRAEIALLLVVVGVTAWLIQAQPPRHVPHPVAAAPKTIDATRTLVDGTVVHLVVRPAAAGPNTVIVMVQPSTDVAEVTLKASNPEHGIAPLDIDLKESSVGHWEAPAAALPLGGTWRFDIAVRRGEFDEDRTHVDAEIAGHSPTHGG